METHIEIIEKENEYTLEIEAKIPTWKMPVVIWKAYKDIEKYISKNNSQPSGPPFVRYLNIDWSGIKKENKILGFIKMFTRKWSMVIGFPVNNKLKGEKKIKAGVFPGGKYVKSIHRGAYQQVGLTYNILLEYFYENKLRYKNESAEIYLNDPEKTREEDLETIVMIPVDE